MTTDLNDRFFGARFSLYPMTDRFVDVILAAVHTLKRPGLKVITDTVSTCLIGPPETIFPALRDALALAADSEEHVALNVTFSVGCPGDHPAEEGVNLPPPSADVKPQRNGDGATGIARRGTCQFSVYPLGQDDYMTAIIRVIDLAKERGLFTRPANFCTQIEGSLESLFDLLHDAFRLAAEHADHVVMTAAVSCNSPSEQRDR